EPHDREVGGCRREIPFGVGEIQQQVRAVVCARYPLEYRHEARSRAAAERLRYRHGFPRLEPPRRALVEPLVAREQGDARPYLTFERIHLGRKLSELAVAHRATGIERYAQVRVPARKTRQQRVAITARKALVAVIVARCAH